MHLPVPTSQIWNTNTAKDLFGGTIVLQKGLVYQVHKGEEVLGENNNSTRLDVFRV
jgi:hypothetical protein